jgi:hypothetical protein
VQDLAADVIKNVGGPRIVGRVAPGDFDHLLENVVRFGKARGKRSADGESKANAELVQQLKALPAHHLMYIPKEEGERRPARQVMFHPLLRLHGDAGRDWGGYKNRGCVAPYHAAWLV